MKKKYFVVLGVLLFMSMNSFATIKSDDSQHKLKQVTPGNLTFGITGLFLNSSNPSLAPSISSQNANQNHSSGYKVNMGYEFPDTSKDLTLSYTHNNQEK